MTTRRPEVKLAFLIDNTIGQVTDYDVAMAYEFFLGRPPENSAVINSHKQLQFGDMLKEFIQSDEFIGSIYNNIFNGSEVNRLDSTQAPSRQQIAWITKRIILDQGQEKEFYDLNSWGVFFNVLFGLGKGDELDSNHLPEESKTARPDPRYQPDETCNVSQHMSQVENTKTILDKLEIIECMLLDIKTVLRIK